MPPRIPRLRIGRNGLFKQPVFAADQQICPICTLSRDLRLAIPSKRTRNQQLPRYRMRARCLSTVADGSITGTPNQKSIKHTRIELRDALLDLPKIAGSFVNISRLQLAIRGLEQTAGDETIRIAILGLPDGGRSLKKAKQLLRLLAADPLKAEEEWERTLVQDLPGAKPILLRIGHSGTEEGNRSRLVEQVNIESPMLRGHKLEILILEMDPTSKEAGEANFVDTVLVPTMDIPISETGRYSPATTPVHRSIILGDGLIGASTVLGYPIDIDREIIGAAIDLRNWTGEEKLPVLIIDVNQGLEALKSFRQSVDNGLLYEQKWFASRVPDILDWIKSGTSQTEGTTKEPLKKLIESLLQTSMAAIEKEKSRQIAASLSTKASSSDLQKLRQSLAHWAERAHTELRDQLDIAFNDRWRKLGWWKLFWRVDDVSMIATDILNQRFLPDAEKEIIFLAGQIAGAGVVSRGSHIPSKNWAFKRIEFTQPESKLGSGPPPPTMRDLRDPVDRMPAEIEHQHWPLNIPASRTYLVQETIPSLQALAQRLVFQTLSTSSLTSILASLMYVGSVSTSIYEAGAFAAVGIVWSMRRMQGKWETARTFWEGEVREEGRKAVRGVESVVSEVLAEPNQPLEDSEELDKARRAVQRAQTALAIIE